MSSYLDFFIKFVELYGAHYQTNKIGAMYPARKLKCSCGGKVLAVNEENHDKRQRTVREIPKYFKIGQVIVDLFLSEFISVVYDIEFLHKLLKNTSL